MLMDEEYLLFNSDYLPKEVHDKNNISSLYELTDRQSVCSNQLEKLPTFTLNNTEIDAINTNFNQNSFLINDNYLSGKDSNKSSATLKFFEQFTDSDENDEDYLKSNYYQNGTKLSPTSIQNVKLLNEMLSHKMSLCSNKPRTKAITSCSSLLRHSVSMPNSRLLNQPNRHLKLALNSQRSPSYERKVEVKSEPQFSNMPKKVYLISNSPTSLSNTTTPNDDVFSVLEDHQYYARRAPVSPPPAKKRYFMPQFKSSSASTINSSVTSISNSNTMNHDFKSIKDNNNDSDYDFYVNNQSKYGTTIYSDNYRNKNRKAYSKLEKQKNNGMSILETFLRATCPLDPSKGIILLLFLLLLLLLFLLLLLLLFLLLLLLLLTKFWNTVSIIKYKTFINSVKFLSACYFTLKLLNIVIDITAIFSICNLYCY